MAAKTLKSLADSDLVTVTPESIGVSWYPIARSPDGSGSGSGAGHVSDSSGSSSGFSAGIGFIQ
jgi:hypothetical protein